MENTKIRIAAIGDVHGCMEELEELLQKIGFYDGKIDKIIFVGDLIDKGPDPVGVMTWAKKWASCCFFVMGNHEEKHLRYHMHERRVKKNPKYRNPMTVSEDFLRTRQALLEIKDWDAFAFMDTWNHYHYLLDEGNHLVLHGGLLPGIKAEDMPPKIITRVRYLKSETEMAHIDEITDTMPFWTDKYTGPEKIIFGHQPMFEVHSAPYAVGIDLGCVHGNKLCAYLLHENTFVTVPAKKTYFPLKISSTGKLGAGWKKGFMGAGDD